MREFQLSDHVRLFRAEGGPTAGHAIVAFGGIAQGLGIPVFEFFQTISSLGIDCLFIRDPAQGWYQKPIQGLGTRPSEMAGTIRRLADTHFPGRRIVTIGNSMGGYAALQFTALCGFDRTVCFSPQTFISAALRARHHDHRWPEQINAIADAECDDVVPLLRQPADVYVGRRDRLDLVHAERLAPLANVKLHVLDACGHDAANWLREQGRLPNLLAGI